MGIPDILAALDHEIGQLILARALLSRHTEPEVKPGRSVKTAMAPALRKKRKKKRNLTPEGRKRIAEAVKRRWAAQKKAAAAK
jgi:hypothetical protein